MSSISCSITPEGIKLGIDNLINSLDRPVPCVRLEIMRDDTGDQPKARLQATRVTDSYSTLVMQKFTEDQEECIQKALKSSGFNIRIIECTTRREWTTGGQSRFLGYGSSRKVIGPVVNDVPVTTMQAASSKEVGVHASSMNYAGLSVSPQTSASSAPTNPVPEEKPEEHHFEFSLSFEGITQAVEKLAETYGRMNSKNVRKYAVHLSFSNDANCAKAVFSFVGTSTKLELTGFETEQHTHLISGIRNKYIVVNETSYGGAVKASDAGIPGVSGNGEYCSGDKLSFVGVEGLSEADMRLLMEQLK